MESALALVREQAPAPVAIADARFAGILYVYVVGDASEPLGAAIAAACRASAERITSRAALKAIAAEVSRRHAQNGNLPFADLMQADGRPSDEREESIERLRRRLSSKPFEETTRTQRKPKPIR